MAFSLVQNLFKAFNLINPISLKWGVDDQKNMSSSSPLGSSQHLALWNKIDLQSPILSHALSPNTPFGALCNHVDS